MTESDNIKIYTQTSRHNCDVSNIFRQNLEIKIQFFKNSNTINKKKNMYIYINIFLDLRTQHFSYTPELNVKLF